MRATHSVLIWVPRQMCTSYQIVCFVQCQINKSESDLKLELLTKFPDSNDKNIFLNNKHLILFNNLLLTILFVNIVPSGVFASATL